MTDEATAQPERLRGHRIYFDGQQFRYVDTSDPTAGTHRPCGLCGERDTPEGHDACIKNLPAVMNACCGHGFESDCYVQLIGGKCLRGNDAMQLMRLLEKAIDD